jgi:hypothetical protein
MIEIGHGVAVDEQTIDRWAENVRLRYMCATGEIGTKWLDVPDEMRAAWRDLTRSAAQQACQVLALALSDSGRVPSTLAADLDRYMTYTLNAGQLADTRRSEK